MTRTAFDDLGYAPSDLELELDLMMGAGEFEDEAEAYVGSRRRINRRSRNYVRWLQRSINQVARQSILKVDGIMGPRTRAAVRNFQRRYRLKVDGIAGPQTERALVRAGASPPPSSYTRPPRPSSTVNTYGDVYSNNISGSGNVGIAGSDNTTNFGSHNTSGSNNNNDGDTYNIYNYNRRSKPPEPDKPDSSWWGKYRNWVDESKKTDLGRTIFGAVRGGLTSAGGLVGGAVGALGGPLAPVTIPLGTVGGASVAGGIAGALTEMEEELESEGALTPEERLQVDSYLENLGQAAANAPTEAEAEALVGAMVPLASELIPRVKPLMMVSSPAMAAGLGEAAKLLHRNPKTRPLLRTMPTILHHTAAVLNRDKINGRQPTPKRAVKVLADQAAKVIASPTETRRALQHAQEMSHHH